MKTEYNAPGCRQYGLGRRWEVESLGEAFRMWKSGTIIFVEIPSNAMTENQQIQKLAARNGSYTYTDTNGASRTVEKWTSIDTSASPASGQ